MLPVPHDEQSDVITRKNMVIGVNPKQLRRPDRGDARFFFKLPMQCQLDGFAELDAAAGQHPSRHIGLAHQKDTIVGIENHAPGAERQCPLPAPIALQYVPDDLFPPPYRQIVRSLREAGCLQRRGTWRKHFHLPNMA